jgi:TonB family protein
VKFGPRGTTPKLVTVLVAAGLLAPFAWSQHATTDEGGRKVKSRVAPIYPDLAKRMAVTGKVKIEVVITPDGKVKATHVIGGHPLLVSPSIEAVKGWRFDPGTEETTQIVVFAFKEKDKTE